jgi:hypothetical protein
MTSWTLSDQDKQRIAEAVRAHIERNPGQLPARSICLIVAALTVRKDPK